MSNYLTGVGSYAVIGEEANYRGSVANYNLLNMTSESLNATYNKSAEENLLATKTATAAELKSVDVSGSISTILKPEFTDWAFKATLGKVSTTTNGDFTVDTYTLVEPNGDIPSSKAVISRGGIERTYDGLVVNSLTLTCPTQDYVTADFDFKGCKEWIGGRDSEKVAPVVAEGFASKSYKCVQAKLFNGEADSTEIADFNFNWNSCPIGTAFDVESTTVTFDNGNADAPATYCSGLYANKPALGMRSVTISCNVPYSADFEKFRAEYYGHLGEVIGVYSYDAGDEPNLALLLALTPSYHHADSMSEPDEQLFILLPNVQITEASSNVGGQGLIDASFTGNALSVGSTEPVYVIHKHKN